MSSFQKRKDRERRIREAKVRAKMTPAQVAREKTARRVCGDCQACCMTLAIPTLQKPRAVRCPNQCAAGCAIYATRPTECAGYMCLWRDGWGVESDRPDKLGAVIDLDVNPAFARVSGARGLNVTVKGSEHKTGGMIRVHLNDETAPMTALLRQRIDEFVAVGEGVIVSYTDRIVVYGPKCVSGLTFTLEELEHLNVEIAARRGESPA